MYILTNRDNIIVDILSEARYIKLQPISNLVIGCIRSEGTGVIGSDCDTHYPLIKSDQTSNPRAVNVIEVEKIPSEVMDNIYKEIKEVNEMGDEIIRKELIPNLYKYINNEFTYVHTLDEAKTLKQEENKKLFAEFLATHPLTWVDGKTYGITQEDQAEIGLNLMQYNNAVTAGDPNPILEWHAVHEECTSWDVETLVALSMDISKAVYPSFHKMQQYKTAIFNCATREELNAIVLDYNEAVE